MPRPETLIPLSLARRELELLKAELRGERRATLRLLKSLGVKDASGHIHGEHGRFAAGGGPPPAQSENSSGTVPAQSGNTPSPPPGVDHISAAVSEAVAGLDPHEASHVTLLAVKAATKAHAALARLTPAMFRALDTLGLVFDTPDDLRKFGWSPGTSGTATGDAMAAGDPVRAATGVPSHIAAAVAAKVLGAGLVWVRQQLGMPPMVKKAEEAPDFAGLAAVLAEAFGAVAAELGVDAPDPAAVLAAVQAAPPVVKAVAPDTDDPHASLYEAALAAVLAAREAGDDDAVPGIVDAYREHLDDPDTLAAALAAAGGDDAVMKAIGAVILKAGRWDTNKHPRDDHGRFVSRDAIADAKGDPAKEEALRDKVTDPEEREKLDNALAGTTDLGRTKAGQQKHEAGQRRAKRAADHARAGEIADKIGAGTATHEEMHELGDHLEGLTVDKLRALQSRIPTAGRTPRKADMVAALRESLERSAHAKRVGDGAAGVEPRPAADHARLALAGMQPNRYDVTTADGEVVPAGKGYQRWEGGGKAVGYTAAEAANVAAGVTPDHADRRIAEHEAAASAAGLDDVQREYHATVADQLRGHKEAVFGGAKGAEELPPQTPPTSPAGNRGDASAIIRDVRGTIPMTQPRAKHGEVGPNGETYPGGAFIATQDLPKKLKDRLSQKATGRVQTRDGWTTPEPGQMSIVSKLGGTVMDPRTGEVNEKYLEYQKYSPEERAMYADIAAKFKAGEDWVNVNDYPSLARLEDVARLYAAGQPVPGAVLDVLPVEYRDRLKKWTPTGGNAASGPTPADIEDANRQMRDMERERQVREDDDAEYENRRANWDDWEDKRERMEAWAADKPDSLAARGAAAAARGRMAPPDRGGSVGTVAAPPAESPDAELDRLSSLSRALTPAERTRRDQLRREWGERQLRARGATDVRPPAGGGKGPGVSDGENEGTASPAPASGPGGKPQTADPHLAPVLAAHAAAPEGSKLRDYLDAAVANASPAGHDASNPPKSLTPEQGRRLRKELASAHADAHQAGNLSPEDDAAFGNVMEGLGVKPLHEVGATVPFDPATMESAAGVSTGVPVRVQRRGWSGLYGDAKTGHENVGNNVRRAVVVPAAATVGKPTPPEKPVPAAKPARKPKADTAATSGYGQSGADHPLAGLDRESQWKRLGHLSGDSGEADRERLIASGPPKGLNLDTFNRDVHAAIAHADDQGLNAATAEAVYDRAGKKHGLTKAGFIRAMAALHNDEDNPDRMGRPGASQGTDLLAAQGRDPELMMPDSGGAASQFRLPRGADAGSLRAEGGRLYGAGGAVVVPAAAAVGKPTPEAKTVTPAPQKQAAPKVRASIKSAYDQYAGVSASSRDGLVPIPRMFHDVKRDNPDMTPEQFKVELLRMRDAGDVELHVVNEVHSAKQPELAPTENDRLLYYLMWKKK